MRIPVVLTFQLYSHSSCTRIPWPQSDPLSQNMATLLVIPCGVQDDNENGHKILFHLSYFNHQPPKQLQFSIFFHTSLFSNKIIKLSNNCHLTNSLTAKLALSSWYVSNNLFCRSYGNWIKWGLLGQSAKKRQEFILHHFRNKTWFRIVLTTLSAISVHNTHPFLRLCKNSV